MSYRTPAPPEPTSAGEIRSSRVFACFLPLVFLAVSFPEMPPQALLGILWTGLGLLMVLSPPTEKIPRVWLGLAAGFVAFSLTGFLPKGGFAMPSWRAELESLGLDTGPTLFPQTWLAAETMAGFAFTALAAVYLLGSRVNNRQHLNLAMAFALGIGLWALVAVIRHEPDATFGFFPNRNHSATLLAMGAFAGLAAFSQAVRRGNGWWMGLSVPPAALCLYALLAVSVSRAGIVLAAAGFVAWILLTGFRRLQGHAGKAVALLLVAFLGMFLIADSKVKTRLTETVERLETQAEPDPGLSFQETTAPVAEIELDGRISIFRDTFSMVAGEPWHGVGPGQFVRVFPHYRERTTASNDAVALHPESDWLMMWSEVGWPATLCLAAGVALVFWSGGKRAWSGRSRPLRMGTLVAAMMVVLHGVFDVPGHRVGIAWAGIFLLAISLRARADGLAENSILVRSGWRVAGILPLIAGIALLHAQTRGNPLLPSTRVMQAMVEAAELYQQDQAAYDQALADGRDYQPEPAEDPLDKALVRVEGAIRLSPLDPHLHYVRGALALHFDDKPDLATSSFAIQRKLVPNRVRIPLEQARAHPAENQAAVPELWREALKRARSEQSRFPNSHSGVSSTFLRILRSAGADSDLQSAALALAKPDKDLLAQWAKSAPVGVLDKEMPQLIDASKSGEFQKSLYQAWKSRGSKAAIEAFENAHPSFKSTEN